MASDKKFTSQVDACYQQLRRMIVSCEFPPGTRLNEKMLIERLGFGRTPIREALLRLDYDQLVETKQRSGYLVRPLTRESVTDLLLVWRDIVPLVASLSCQKMTEKQREGLLADLAQYRSEERKDGFAPSKKGRRLLDRLVDIADNESLSHVYRHLAGNLERITVVLYRIAEGPEWVDTLEAIQAILSETDPDRAAKAARDRVSASNQFLFRFLDEYSESETILPYFEETKKGQKKRAS